jgi:pSer/pThr/pTyr-binding forkhead associated (FHA) protein
MNKIIINRGSFKLNEVVFEQGTTSIGRGSDNTIALDDTAVSNHHAKIVTLFHTSYIEDLDSTNGTLVNGKSVQKRTLHSGDVISVGNHQLLFQSENSAQKDSETSETVMLHGSEIKQRLNEFMQAQAEHHHQANTNKRSSDQAANAGLSNKDANAKPAASKSGFGNGASSVDMEKNRAWLDAYKKSQSAGKPQSATAPKPSSTIIAKTKVAETSNPASPAAPNAVQTNEKTETDTKVKTEAETKVTEIKAKFNTKTTSEGGTAPKIETNPAQPSPDLISQPPSTPDLDSVTSTNAIRNTAAAIRATQKPAAEPVQQPETATPLMDSDANASPDIAAAPTSSPASQEWETMKTVDIAAAARAATQHRRKTDDNIDANGAMALDTAKSRSKFMPLIWIIIVAVLVAEVVYITYRSFIPS